MQAGDGAVQYRSYEIESASQKLKDRPVWTVGVVITKHHDGSGASNQRHFSIATTCPTKAEADAMALRLGRDIIDGKVAEHTVDDL